MRFAEVADLIPEEGPIPKYAFELVDDEPPSREMPEELTVTRSARTFVSRRGLDPRTLVRESDLLEGAYELIAPDLERVLPVQEFQHGTGGAGAMRSEADAPRVRQVDVPGLIPDWIGKAYHPRPLPPAHLPIQKLDGRYFRLDSHPPGPYGPDDRISITPASYPYTAVCKLRTFWTLPNKKRLSMGDCTGFLVGSRCVLTSGHCFPEPPYYAPIKWAIQVIPAFKSGQSVKGSGIKSWATNGWWWNEDAGSDYAILRLYDALGDTCGYFGATAYTDDWEDEPFWEMTGYPDDRNGGDIPVTQSGISVFDDDDGSDLSLPGDGDSFDTTQVESFADSWHGASGSPLWSWFKSGHCKVIGVHRGAEEDSLDDPVHSVASGGEFLKAVIWWARENWD